MNSQAPKYMPQTGNCLNFIPRGCTVPPSAVFSGFTSVTALAWEVWTDWDDTPADVLACAGSIGSLSCLGGCSLVTCASTSDWKSKLLRQY